MNAEWCSIYNAPPGCSPQMSNGQALCKPLTPGARTAGENLQRALNALLKQDKKQLVTIDGVIGPATVAGTMAYAGTGYGNSCQSVADNIGALTARLTAFLAARNQALATTAVAPPTNGPQVALLPAARAGFPLWAGVALFGGLGLWLYLKGGDKKGAPPSVGGF